MLKGLYVFQRLGISPQTFSLSVYELRQVQLLNISKHPIVPHAELPKSGDDHLRCRVYISTVELRVQRLLLNQSNFFFPVVIGGTIYAFQSKNQVVFMGLCFHIYV